MCAFVSIKLYAPRSTLIKAKPKIDKVDLLFILLLLLLFIHSIYVDVVFSYVRMHDKDNYRPVIVAIWPNFEWVHKCHHARRIPSVVVHSISGLGAHLLL